MRSKKDVLLGASRADLATLIVKKAIDDCLSESGIAAIYLPLSIFFNSGANDFFRPYPESDHKYRVARLWDFGSEEIFDGVTTRYGAALFEKRANQTWPVETLVRQVQEWQRSFSTSSDGLSGHWVRHESAAAGPPKPPAISIAAGQTPRAFPGGLESVDGGFRRGCFV